jgi:hypothetical protein
VKKHTVKWRRVVGEWALRRGLFEKGTFDLSQRTRSGESVFWGKRMEMA